MNEDEQLKVVRKLPQVAQKQSLYGTHRRLLELVKQTLVTKTQDIEFEQMIMSGVHNNTELSAISDAEMLKQMTKKFETRPSARLLCIFTVCYNVPDKDFKKLVSSLKANHDTVDKIRMLANNPNKSLKRVWPVYTNDQK